MCLGSQWEGTLWRDRSNTRCRLWVPTIPLRGGFLARQSIMAEPPTDERSPSLIPMPRPPTVGPRPTVSRRSFDVRGPALTVLMVLAGVVAMQWARPLLVPIIFGILISYALEPMVRRLTDWRVPHVVAASVVFVGTVSIVGALGYALSHQLVAVADRLPSAALELREALQARGQGAPGPVAKVQEAANELQKLSGSDAPASPAIRKVPTVAIEKKPFDLGDYLWQGSLSVTTFMGDTVVVLFLALYLLLAGDMFRRRFVEIAGPTLSQKKITLHILDAISLQISRYLFVRAVISVIVGLGTFAAFWAVGLEQPAVWGVAAGLLNVIPYVGPIVIVAAAGVAAFLQFHTVYLAVLTAGLATAVASVEAYIITPWLMSRTAEMNPAAVFIGLLFWGWLWGLPGLFLAVPILMVAKSVSDHVEVLHPVATLLKA
jgi:predicted PurR-regulated permease PerM